MKIDVKPILESSGGIHLTAYLINRGSFVELKTQLRQTLEEAEEWLHILPPNRRKAFLTPLISLSKELRILKKLKGNIGIFRNEKAFWVISIPVDVKQMCQVATSFHVKPLLRWLQDDQEFYLIGLEEQKIHLYSGNLHSTRALDPIPIINGNFQEGVRALNTKLHELSETANAKIYLAGEPSYVNYLIKNLEHKCSGKTFVSGSFSRSSAGKICTDIRQLLQEEAKRKISNALTEFRFAEAHNQTRKNIFQISKAAIQGKVRKLIISDDLYIFGKIDRASGGLAIHPTDQDHEDDCILDDLSQIVLNNGGEVVVAKRAEIPKGRPALAILKDIAEYSSKHAPPALSY